MLCVNDSEVAGREHSSGAVENDFAASGNEKRPLHGYCLRCSFNIILSHINLFTTIHDGNFRRHSSMNVTIK